MLDKETTHNDENEFVPEANDEILNDVELEAEEEISRDKIKDLRKKLDEAEKEKMRCMEDLQRTKADFLNSRRRLEEQLQRDEKRINERHIEKILPLADSFEMAMKDPAWKEADEKWRKGVEGIYAQLINIFKQNSVSIIDPLGEEFNPYEHEAIIDSGSDNGINEVFQKGYKIDDRVIRPAKVAVGKK